jgi:hypothetical protein
MTGQLSIEGVGAVAATDTTLEALFVVNRIAKQYARRATDAYEQGFGGAAKTESLRKGALYRLKSHVLGVLYVRDDVDEIQKHYIDGEAYYCLQIGEFQFHAPIVEFEESVNRLDTDTDGASGDSPDSSRVEEEVTDVEYLSEFTTSDTVPGEMMSEREALQHIAREFRSANTFVHPFNDGRPIGWSYLPDYVEEGARIPESEFQGDHRGEFLFAVGDTFETTQHGSVTIADRYGQWLSRRFSRDSILPRPVYDVELGDTDERETGVRRERIMDDWRIRVDDPGDPLPEVEGPLADRVDSYDLGFDVGDVLTLDRGAEDGPRVWKVDHFSVHGSLLEVHFEPWDGDWAAPLTPEEFVDDVVDITRE